MENVMRNMRIRVETEPVKTLFNYDSSGRARVYRSTSIPAEDELDVTIDVMDVKDPYQPKPVAYIEATLFKFRPSYPLNRLILIADCEDGDLYSMAYHMAENRVFKKSYRCRELNEGEYLYFPRCPDYYCDVNLFYVVPEYRGKGIGSYLISRLRDMMEERIPDGDIIACAGLYANPFEPELKGADPDSPFEKCHWNRTCDEEMRRHMIDFAKKHGFFGEDDGDHEYMFKDLHRDDEEDYDDRWLTRSQDYSSASAARRAARNLSRRLGSSVRDISVYTNSDLDPDDDSWIVTHSLVYQEFIGNVRYL